MSKQAARMRAKVQAEFDRVFCQSQPLESDVLDIAVEVIMNGPGTAAYRDGVVDLLINLYGAAGDGDITLKSNL